MKKLSRLIAAVLTGVLLLTLTACSGGAVVETLGRRQILNSINSYRTGKGFARLEEVQALSDVENAALSVFKEQNLTVLDTAGAIEVQHRYSRALSAVLDRWQPSGGIGAEYFTIGGEAYISLALKLTPGQLRSQIEESGIFDNDYITAAGIGLVTINGTTYWSVSAYVERPEA